MATDLHVFKGVLLRYATQDVLLAAFLQFSSQKQFVQDIVGLREREDDVQFADIAVILVHLLDVSVDDFESDQLVVFGRASGNEEEGGISTIYYLGVYRLRLEHV